MIKLVISGIAGRMGKRIALLASKDKGFELKGGLESSGNPTIGKDIGELIEINKIGKAVESDFASLTEACDVLIEFTNAFATMEHLEIACKNEVGMVIGTTALSNDEIKRIKDASKEIPIVFSPNMSVGANVLFKITEIISKALGKDYKVEIVEAHHAKKKDAPSGTAKR